MIKTYICVIILVYYFKRGENLKHSFKKVMENTQVNYKIGFKDIAKTFIELVSGKKAEQSKSEEETEKRIKEIEKMSDLIRKKRDYILDKENFIRESIQQFEDKNQRNYFLKRINNPRITEGIIGDRTFDKWFMFYLNLLYVE